MKGEKSGLFLGTSKTQTRSSTAVSLFLALFPIKTSAPEQKKLCGIPTLLLLSLYLFLLLLGFRSWRCFGGGRRAWTCAANRMSRRRRRRLLLLLPWVICSPTSLPWSVSSFLARSPSSLEFFLGLFFILGFAWPRTWVFGSSCL